MILVRGGIKIRMREQELDEQSREQDFKRDVAMLLLKREDRETRETETDRQRERVTVLEIYFSTFYLRTAGLQVLVIFERYT